MIYQSTELVYINLDHYGACGDHGYGDGKWVMLIAFSICCEMVKIGDYAILVKAISGCVFLFLLSSSDSNFSRNGVC